VSHPLSIVAANALLHETCLQHSSSVSYRMDKPHFQ